MRPIRERIPVALAALAIAAALVLGIRSVVADPGSAPSAAPPNPGHSWSQIGDFPGTIWHSNNDGTGSGLDADAVDGLHASEIGGVVSGTVQLMRRDNNWGPRLTGGSFNFGVWEFWSNHNIGTGVLQIGPFTAGTRIWFQGRAGWQVCDWRLIRLSDDAILISRGGDNATEYRFKNFDTTPYVGTQVYLEVDNHSPGECGWRGPVVIEP